MELRWGILSVFPKPLPIRHDARLFPRLFTTDEFLELPYVPYDPEIASLGEDRNFTLKSSLCFQVVSDRSQLSPCILLYNQTAGWFDLPDTNDGVCHSTNATWISGWWPARLGNGSTAPPRQPKRAPYCWGMNWGQMWPWTCCQSHTIDWADKEHYFTFSPGISTLFNQSFAGNNFTDQDPRQEYVSNPFDNWLLCGINGSCMNLEPMVMLGGGMHGISHFTWSSSQPWGSFSDKATSNGNSNTHTPCVNGGVTPQKNISYAPTPVCVYPPFLFVVSKSIPSYCTNKTCFYAQCWNATEYEYAIVTRMPRWVPVPVQSPNAMSVFRVKRDFGITAAIVTAISLAAVAATTAAIAMSHTVQTAQTLNNLSANVAHALDVQRSASAQLKGGLMLVNQRIDLVQEEVDILWQMAQLGCEWRSQALCVTSVQYRNFSQAANLSKNLSSYLTGNWSGDFEATMEKLRVAIAAVNATRIDPGVAEGLAAWMSTALNHLKEWAGMGALAGLMVLIFLICLWCICKMRFTQRRSMALIVQAFTALEESQSPKVWLAALKD